MTPTSSQIITQTVTKLSPTIYPQAFFCFLCLLHSCEVSDVFKWLLEFDIRTMIIRTVSTRTSKRCHFVFQHYLWTNIEFVVFDLQSVLLDLGQGTIIIRTDVSSPNCRLLSIRQQFFVVHCLPHSCEVSDVVKWFLEFDIRTMIIRTVSLDDNFQTVHEP